MSVVAYSTSDLKELFEGCPKEPEYKKKLLDILWNKSEQQKKTFESVVKEFNKQKNIWEELFIFEKYNSLIDEEGLKYFEQNEEKISNLFFILESGDQQNWTNGKYFDVYCKCAKYVKKIPYNKKVEKKNKKSECRELTQEYTKFLLDFQNGFLVSDKIKISNNFEVFSDEEHIRVGTYRNNAALLFRCYNKGTKTFSNYYLDLLIRSKAACERGYGIEARKYKISKEAKKKVYIGTVIKKEFFKDIKAFVETNWKSPNKDVIYPSVTKNKKRKISVYEDELHLLE